jgi:hypothetical protein
MYKKLSLIAASNMPNTNIELLLILVVCIFSSGCNSKKGDVANRESDPSNSQIRSENKAHHPRNGSGGKNSNNRDEAQIDHSLDGGIALDRIFDSVSQSDDKDIDSLLAWIFQQSLISDDDWKQIQKFAELLDNGQKTQILLDLSLKDISSDRGINLFKSTLDGIGSGVKRMSAIKHAILNLNSDQAAAMLVFLDRNGYPEDLSQAIGFLIKSDSIRGAQSDLYIQTLMGSPVLTDNPAIATELAKKFGDYFGSADPNLKMRPLGFLNRLEDDIQKQFVREYYNSVLKNGDFISKFDSREIIESGIPADVLLENMAAISHLDFLKIGPKKSLEQFSVGESVVGNSYIKTVFMDWLKFDSVAASKYLADLSREDAKVSILAPEISRFARSRGDEELAAQWDSYLRGK